MTNSIAKKSKLVIRNEIKSLHDRGWVVVPVRFKTKKPNRSDWQKRTLADVDIANEFQHPTNVGVLLGEPSGGLVDIDLDCDEAIILAQHLLPPTGVVFGRKSKPCSHYLYIVQNCGGVERLKHPDGGVLVEYRGNGGQTIFPPSVHLEGEAITFDRFDEPGIVSHDELIKAVKKVAAGCILVRCWQQGQRHD